MADSSFDVVSKADRQEVDNALNQAAKELSTRFDFRGTDTTIEWQGEEGIILVSSTEERVKAAVDVFKEKLIRRDISMKAFDAGDPQAVRQDLQGHRQHQAGHRQRERQEDHQADPRRRAQGRQGADPGRRDPRQLQEARRPSGRPGVVEEGRPRGRGAVRQLPLSQLGGDVDPGAVIAVVVGIAAFT